MVWQNLNNNSNSNNNDYFANKWSHIVGSCLVFTFLVATSYIFRDYVHSVLRWVESQSNPLVFLILVGLYILVSLPFAWGYIVINIATGYLYGMLYGIVVTFITATIGIFVAHLLIKAFLVKHVQQLLHYTAKSGSTLKILESLMASKRDSFQLVLLSRFTPIPFGLQNSIFALSTMSTAKYLQASCIGLLPCQVINVYLGSTLRSMEEVLGDSNTATVGLIVLAVQLAFVGVVVVFVVNKAKQEFEKAVINSTSSSIEIAIPTKEDPDPGGVSLKKEGILEHIVIVPSIHDEDQEVKR